MGQDCKFVRLMTTSKEGGFLAKAMELCNSMMQFSGCELYSHNTRSLLEGLNKVLDTIDGYSTQVGCIRLLVDTLLEEEGIAEAELLAGCDDYEDSDEYYRDCLYDSEPEYTYPDPVHSRIDAFEVAENADCVIRAAEDIELTEYANTPHDELNAELKALDEERKSISLGKAIQHARESVMDRIVFTNGDSYPIHRLYTNFDEVGKPIDIEISARKEVCDAIAQNHGYFGYNFVPKGDNLYGRALYGQLDDFLVKDYEGRVKYTRNTLYNLVTKLDWKDIPCTVWGNAIREIISNSGKSAGELCRLDPNDIFGYLAGSDVTYTDWASLIALRGEVEAMMRFGYSHTEAIDEWWK